MPKLSLRRLKPVLSRWPTLLCAFALLAGSAVTAAEATTLAVADPARSSAVRTLSFHGYQIDVPTSWRVVDLTARPHACLRFDQPAVYLGRAGDQARCPSHVIGGAPGLHLEPLDQRSGAQLTRSTVLASQRGVVRSGRLPHHGPVTIAVPAAGVVATAVYGQRSAATARRILEHGRVLATAQPKLSTSLPTGHTSPGEGISAPGTYVGRGFDACTAPSQAAMDAWRGSTRYRAVGVYIGGVSRGCAQPNLTAAWVARQARSGWHPIPTYVGRQAPCTGFYNRISFDPRTARVQGRVEGRDAVARATDLGIAAPSTLFSDIEGYDNTNSACVAAVLSYVSGWTRALHAHGYRAGVYSSAASGIRDLSASHTTAGYNAPDQVWLAWWNGVADVDGGNYLPDTQWSSRQRIHQYAGNVAERHGGYRIVIDRDFLDVSPGQP